MDTPNVNFRTKFYIVHQYYTNKMKLRVPIFLSKNIVIFLDYTNFTWTSKNNKIVETLEQKQLTHQCLIYNDIIQTKYLHVGGLIISLSQGIITLITDSTESLAAILLAQLRRYKTISDMGSFVKQLVVLVLQRLGTDL